jgi:hypothetical protein
MDLSCVVVVALVYFKLGGYRGGVNFGLGDFFAPRGSSLTPSAFDVDFFLLLGSWVQMEYFSNTTQVKPSRIKLQITIHAFCTVERATALNK